MSAAKRTVTAYVLAIVGGLVGLHHLYLRRTQHALLWFTTFGGFGVGLLYELLFSIRNYVREANDDRQLHEQNKKKMREQKSPSFELIRFGGQYVVAMFYGFIAYYAFPDTWLQQRFTSLIVTFCSAVAIALGTHLAGTLGPRQCSFVWPLLGAVLGMSFLTAGENKPPAFNITALFACLAFEWKIDWDPQYIADESEKPKPTKKDKPRRHFVKRCLILGCGAIVFGLLVSSAIYQNLHVDLHGERVKVKDVLSDLFKSQEFIQLSQQLSSVMKQLYAFYLQYGFKGIWTQIWAELSRESDKQAYEILNLKSSASQKDIEVQCRTLSRKWHPDRYRDPVEKQKAEVTFMNIQQACNRLSAERKRRQDINTKKRDNP